MLAYVFWHRPRHDGLAYQEALLELHAALAEAPPPGFRGSGSFARAEMPWMDGYEDWYLVDDWTALGVLNDVAPRYAAHDPVADLSRDGAGGVFALQAGEPDLGGVEASTYGEDPVAGDVIWRRQLVLGPAPQYLAQHFSGDGELPRRLLGSR